MLAILAALALDMEPVDFVARVDARRLRATVERLAKWPQRNTSEPTLTEAAEWIAAQYRAIPGLEVEIMQYPIAAGPRVPAAKEVVQVLATLRGQTSRRILVGGHLDTINMTPGATTASIAPGANDDATGVAVALEAARVLAGRTWKNTLTFVAWSGEEQGLLGSRAMARRAKAENWEIEAVLSNDMVGNSRNLRGESNAREVRIFSEESPDHESRELARFLEWNSRGKIRGYRPRLVFRRDRFGRGGDHTPFNQEGFTAVRFVEVHEEYAHQHTPDDRPEFIDWNYLAKAARLNVLSLATLAGADPAPTEVRVDRRQGYDTRLTWRGTPRTKYIVYVRETTSPVWQYADTVGAVSETTLAKFHKDDHVFAVGAVGGIPVEAK